MTDSLLLTLEPDVQPLAYQLLARARVRFPGAIIASGRRTCLEQNTIYAKGRTAPGVIVTSARGCQSWHVFGRAFDIDLGSKAKVSDYALLGEYWVKLGGKWGGDFKDYGHFEYHPGMTIESACPDPSRCMDTLTPVFYGFPGLSAKSPEFRCELWKVGQRLGVNPNWLAAVIYSESGFDSKIRNAYCLKNQPCAPDCCAVGLIQFMPVAAAALKTTTVALYSMTDVQQLSYVEKFYSWNKSKLRRPVDLYMATFLPAFIGADGETVLGRRGDTTILYERTSLDTVYRNNAGFDSSGKGYFTVADIGARVDGVLNAAKARAPIAVDCTCPKGLMPVEAPGSCSYSEPAELPILRLGCFGNAVELWQRLMGFRGDDVDGKFGPVMTEPATKKWQRAHGLLITGLVDAKTWKTVM